ncbi:RDD family protein [Pseudonocardia ammonioxydans]|uniref:RDD family protein n=1 Tax=Pseudonocardia ammonioxydans TaxID=260086 RepID=A0A1I4V8H3_PSUAM|nr:RDD family protein [Pseudonocardia ammonioxydans]SFM97455.1 RDD family protein [Pseudonocardia ammonioxydans]
MHELAAPRGKAYLRDCVRYLGIAVATAPLGALAGRARERERLHAFASVVSVVPPLVATVLAARAEARYGATPGKRSHGLQVTAAGGGSAGTGRCLLRNIAKIAVPWQLGHMATIAGVFGGIERRDPLAVAITVAAYALPAVMVTCVVTGSGRAIHDRIAGTAVRPAGLSDRRAGVAPPAR